MLDIIVGFLFLLAIYRLYVYFKDPKKFNEEREQAREELKDTFDNLKKNIKDTGKTSTSNELYNQAKEIADKITTQKGIESLEDRIDRIYEKDNLTSADQKKISILEKAIDIASDKPFRYYFENYDVDMHTPLSILNYAGKVLTPKQFDELDESTQEYFEMITIGDCEDVSEAKEIAFEELTDDVKEWKKFRKILESSEDNIEKSKKLKKLVDQSDFLKSELDFDEDEDYYEQYLHSLYFYEKLKELEDIPEASLFINNGFDSKEKILKLTDKEISSIKGIGPKKLDNIKEALKKYK